jgi:lipase chaperone LimK
MEEKRKLEILNRELEIENNILKQRCKQEREENRKRINELELERNELQDKIDSIIYSRSYKLVKKITNILKRG